MTTPPPTAVRLETRGFRPRGFRLELGFAADRAEELAEWCATSIPWEKRRRGRSAPAQFYSSDEGNVPAWASELGARMLRLGIFPELPNHVMVLKYRRGAGMHPHVDFPAYGPIVAGLTLGSSRVLKLRRRWSRTRALLMPGDLYVLAEDARYRWKHGIDETTRDAFRGRGVERNDGFSVTWRLRPSKPLV